MGEKNAAYLTEWFLAKYCDPRECCPKNDNKGFQYIYGGPYVAKTILDAHFKGLVETSEITKACQDLEKQCMLWSKRPEFFEESEIPDAEYKKTFDSSMKGIIRLTDLKIPDDLNQIYLRLLYAKAFTALEAYLGDCMKYHATITDMAVERFLERCSAINDKKISYKQLVGTYKARKTIILNTLSSIVWHRMEDVENYYQEFFEVELPEIHKAYIMSRMNIRHDIVHRDGISKEGNELVLTVKELQTLISSVKNFVKELDSKVKKVIPSLETKKAA